MMSFFDGFVLELVPHCASVPPEGWTEDHDIRPLSELGHQQARTLAGALGAGVDAIYSSPALRCLQTVRPLGEATGLAITELTELLDTRQFSEPREWTQGLYQPVAQAIGGGWAAGHGLRALAVMARRNPRARVAAASHGDIIPAFFAMLCAMSDAPLPDWPGRGGWYTLRFDSASVTITTHAPPGLGGLAKLLP